MMSLSNSAQAKLAGALHGALLVVAALMSPSALAKTPAQEALEQVRATDATGDGWQTRIDTALQEWLSARGKSTT